MFSYKIWSIDNLFQENNECWFGSVAWRVSDFLFKKIMIRWKRNFEAICDLEASYGVSLFSLVCLQYVFSLTCPDFIWTWNDNLSQTTQSRISQKKFENIKDAWLYFGISGKRREPIFFSSQLSFKAKMFCSLIYMRENFFRYCNGIARNNHPFDFYTYYPLTTPTLAFLYAISHDFFLACALQFALKHQEVKVNRSYWNLKNFWYSLYTV